MIKEELLEMDQGIDQARSFIGKYPKIKLLIKIMGNLVFVYFAIIGLYIHAFIFWLLFFPDSEDLIRYLKIKIFRITKSDT